MADDEVLSFEEWEGDDSKFALRVQGDSLIEAHIIDGDFVVIAKQGHASVGQIIAYRDDDGEPSLRKYFPQRGKVRLEAANRDVKAIYREKVEILGVLVGVVRKY